MNSQILIGFLLTIAVIAGTLVFLLYRKLERVRQQHDESAEWALKLHSEAAESQAKVSIFAHHLAEERERNGALMRANFELTQANAELQARLTGVYRVIYRQATQNPEIHLN
ncbi:MAG: hypothetical protein DCC55_25715 [Chloroflexi bacterium]|nr:MAG: hypothetical protein DCC55_25715 [Chloroflexota bacterium]